MVRSLCLPRLASLVYFKQSATDALLEAMPIQITLNCLKSLRFQLISIGRRTRTIIHSLNVSEAFQSHSNIQCFPVVFRMSNSLIFLNIQRLVFLVKESDLCSCHSD